MYCGQTAGWMKMPLDTQLGLGPGHIVKDATQLPQKGNNSPPIFSPCIVAKRVDGSTCHLIRRYRPRPRRNYVRWGPAPPKGHISRIFGPCLWCRPCQPMLSSCFTSLDSCTKSDSDCAVAFPNAYVFCDSSCGSSLAAT